MSSVPDRTTISRGPALVKFNGAVFFSSGDIVLDFGKEYADVPSSAFGPLFPYLKKIAPMLKIPLIGEVQNLATLFPFGAMAVGMSIFGPTDIPLQIIPLDSTQKKVTFNAAAVFAEPEITLGVSGAALGEVTFRFLPARGVPITANNAWFTEADNDWDGSGFNPDTILIQSYGLSWLSTGTATLTFGANTTGALLWNASASDVAAALNALASITTAGGVTVTGDYRSGYTVTFVSNGTRGNIAGATVNMPAGTTVAQSVITAGGSGAAQVVQLSLAPWGQVSTEAAIKVKTTPKCTEAPSDQIGFYDIIFESVKCVATFIPLGMGQTQLLNAANIQGANAGLGLNLANKLHYLDLFAPGFYIRMEAVTLTKVGAIWGAVKQRVPALEFTAGRIAATGGVGPLYYVGTSAPS